MAKLALIDIEMCSRSDFIYFKFVLLQVIGSSLLFVHDQNNANVWLIDFAKTLILPPELSIDHSSEWVVGNHEDGYMIGVNNLIEIFGEMLERHKSSSTVPTTMITAPPQDPT